MFQFEPISKLTLLTICPAAGRVTPPRPCFRNRHHRGCSILRACRRIRCPASRFPFNPSPAKLHPQVTVLNIGFKFATIGLALQPCARVQKHALLGCPSSCGSSAPPWTACTRFNFVAGMPLLHAAHRYFPHVLQQQHARIPTLPTVRALV